MMLSLPRHLPKRCLQWLALAWCGSACTGAFAAANDTCAAASTGCYFSLTPPAAEGQFHYYASRDPGAPPAVTAPLQALIAVHGHSRDANKTFNATVRAVQQAGRANTTLVVAPVFQVDPSQSSRCSTPGVPSPQDGDLLWTCGSWMEGGAARNGRHPTAFAAMDALVAELHLRWPSLRIITIAGFSAGGQFTQHYIGFAAAPPAGAPKLRYVVADPGTWLYFDKVRPQPLRAGRAVEWSECAGAADFVGGPCSFELVAPAPTDCPTPDRWKYGTEALPASLARTAEQAREQYVSADIGYLEGELDSGIGRGTAARVLDRSCPANAQGPYRLQRGLAFAHYDRSLLAPSLQRRVVVVPGCAHDVACVFPSDAARATLLGPPP